ncbi:hypothetical protein [Parapedobacter tibetensis]|uniref:hypothetical protein n=1 Tax=Parapedobacter tibetensis TaxID=2972951 RepID=UPI00214D8F2D|nr:hypothetical protein [Parapedobacter tibetensis]
MGIATVTDLGSNQFYPTLEEKMIEGRRLGNPEPKNGTVRKRDGLADDPVPLRLDGSWMMVTLGYITIWLDLLHEVFGHFAVFGRKGNTEAIA